MSESNVTSNTCPKCGAALPSGPTGGLCPRCLMAEAMVPTQPGLEEAQAPKALSPQDLAPYFPQLEIIECLGRGGMGVVYKARQKILNRFVALKLLAPEREREAKFAERFTREAQALAALNHPNIVTIYDFGQAGGFYFLLMEFVDGLNLRHLLRTRKFTPEEALAIVPPLCDALQFAHDRSIVHRDIKPENLLLDKSGRIKVADFGIAKMLEAADVSGGKPSEPSAPEMATQTTLGTPGYSAPEQKTHSQRVDSRADIYSLGVVFYEMLTGELPGKRIEPPSRKVQIDVRLDEVVLRALEMNPELRYQHVSEVKTMVETIARTPANAGPSTVRTHWADHGVDSRSKAETTKSHQDWWTWSPLQSKEVREICSHLTKAERNHVSLLGLLSAVWVVGTVSGIPAFVRSQSGSGKWVVASVWVLLFAISIPMLHRLVRHFLCSTTWAKENGFEPEHLRLFSFSRGNLWKVFAVLAVGLGLVFAQQRAITHYLGLGSLTRSNQIQVAHPTRAALTAHNLSFGPVIERVVADSKAHFENEFERTNGLIMIDFDSGMLLAGSSGMWAADTALQKSWMETNGVDAIGVIPGVRGLVCLDMKILSVPPSGWDEISAAAVSEQLARVKVQDTVLMKSQTESPPTWLFQTRKGGMGILQIAGFTENLSGIRIRYKLIQNQGGTTATDERAAALQFRWLRRQPGQSR